MMDYDRSPGSVSHTKSSLVGSSVSIPITNEQLNLGTWQGEWGIQGGLWS